MPESGLCHLILDPNRNVCATVADDLWRGTMVRTNGRLLHPNHQHTLRN